MRQEMNNANSLSGRREFLKSAGAAAAGLCLAGAAPLARAAEPAATAKKEVLAIKGGAKAVTASDQGAVHWPLYGANEEKAVLDVIRSPSYAANAALEQDWKDYFKVPYVKAYCNGTSALTTMFFALNLPAGSEIMVPSYTFFATIMPMRLFGLVPVFVDINPRIFSSSKFQKAV